MKAFVALMFVAAVSGLTTTGLDRGLYDMILRNRGLYGRTGVYSGLKTDVYGDVTTTGFLPSTQQYNIPTDVTLYTLRQLYTLPVFQEYLTLPFFKQYLTVPAFQRYLVSPYFQQYFTQPIFRQFFVDPVLFYKYIYPVVYQFQTGVVGVDQTLFVPEIYRHLVPEIYRNKVVLPETYTTGMTLPTGVYGGIIPRVYNKDITIEDLVRGIVEGKQVYGNVYVDELLRKILLGGNGIYNTGIYGTGSYGNNVFGGLTTADLLRKLVYGQQIYGTTGLNYDLLRKILLGGNGVYGNGVWGPMTNGMWENGLYGNNFYGIKKVLGGGLDWTNTGIHKIAPIVFERVFRDLLDGKITIEDIKGVNTGVFGDKLVENKVVDPITGEIKVVTEKVVKPIDTVLVGGEETPMTNEVLLNKMMLKKNTFNKV